MKRDMELVRKILLEMESKEQNFHFGQIDIEGYSEEMIGFHVFLMDQAGLVRSVDASHMGSPCTMHEPVDITWQGYEFLDMARSPDVWQQAESKVTSTVGTVSLSVLTAVLIDIAKQKLGLP